MVINLVLLVSARKRFKISRTIQTENASRREDYNQCSRAFEPVEDIHESGRLALGKRSAVS